jgi:hypothetical protein
MAQALQTAAGRTVQSEASQQHPQLNVKLLAAIELCRKIVADIGTHLHHAGIAAVPLQQLQQQQAALLALLSPLPLGVPQRDDAEALLALLHTLHSDGALQAVVSFAGSVCGQLPLRWGCNHPGCTNLAQHSEVLLVAGKSCVCGACRAAR